MIGDAGLSATPAVEHNGQMCVLLGPLLKSAQ
jgi:hypothetical protein